jgi:hypothetical protein
VVSAPGSHLGGVGDRDSDDDAPVSPLVPLDALNGDTADSAGAAAMAPLGSGAAGGVCSRSAGGTDNGTFDDSGTTGGGGGAGTRPGGYAPMATVAYHSSKPGATTPMVGISSGPAIHWNSLLRNDSEEAASAARVAASAARVAAADVVAPPMGIAVVSSSASDAATVRAPALPARA